MQVQSTKHRPAAEPEKLGPKTAGQTSFLRACALILILVLAVFLCSAAWEFTNDPYDRFVRTFNAYTDSLNRGVNDLKKLHKARAAWRELEKGWPEYDKR